MSFENASVLWLLANGTTSVYYFNRESATPACIAAASAHDQRCDALEVEDFASLLPPSARTLRGYNARWPSQWHALQMRAPMHPRATVRQIQDKLENIYVDTRII